MSNGGAMACNFTSGRLDYRYYSNFKLHISATEVIQEAAPLDFWLGHVNGPSRLQDAKRGIEAAEAKPRFDREPDLTFE